MLHNKARGMALITKKQIQVMWVLAKQLGMTDEHLHDLVRERTGKDSIKALTVSEAADIIDSIVRAGAKVKAKRRPRRWLPPNVVELATPDQMRFIDYLANQLEWQGTPGRMKGYFRHTIKKDTVRTKQDAIKAIQGLKSILDRKTRKEVNGTI